MTRTQFSLKQYAAAYSEGIELHYWNKARIDIIKDLLERNNLSKMKMLEIGCGKGVVLYALRSSGLDCYGVELAPVAVPDVMGDFMWSGIHFSKLKATLIESIEVILICDVLEHIEHEGAFLESITKTFPNVKCIVITVPARKELWSNYDMYYGHFRRYTLASLEACAGRAGFRSLSATYFFHTLYLPAFILSMFHLKREIKIVPPQNIMKIIHSIIALFFKLEYRCVPSSVPGTSIAGVWMVNDRDKI